MFRQALVALYIYLLVCRGRLDINIHTSRFTLGWLYTENHYFDVKNLVESLKSSIFANVFK